MKVLFYNMAYGTGMNGSWKKYITTAWRFLWTPRPVLRKIADTLEQEKADIVCLAEVDGGSFRSRFRSQAKKLAKRLKYPFCRSETKYHPQSVWQYMMMVRKHHDAVLSMRQGEMKRHHLKSGMKKLVQEFITDGISVFTVHLAVLSKRVRRRQLEELGEILRRCPRPKLLCGDFNIHHGLSELSDFLERSGLNRVETTPTFPSIRPKRYLDLFFASPDVTIEKAGVVPVTYSDHLPVWVKLKAK